MPFPQLPLLLTSWSTWRVPTDPRGHLNSALFQLLSFLVQDPRQAPVWHLVAEPPCALQSEQAPYNCLLGTSEEHWSVILKPGFCVCSGQAEPVHKWQERHKGCALPCKAAVGLWLWGCLALGHDPRQLVSLSSSAGMLPGTCWFSHSGSLGETPGVRQTFFLSHFCPLTLYPGRPSSATRLQ